LGGGFCGKGRYLVMHESGRPPKVGTKGRWLVDDRGAWRAVNEDALCWPEDRADIRVYPRIVDIHWDVEITSRSTLDSIVEWLERLECRDDLVVAIRFRHGAWNTEVYNSRADAGSRIREVSGFAGTQGFNGIMRRRLGLGRAYEGETESALAVETWLRLGGRIERGDVRSLMTVLPRTLVFRHVANDNTWVYSYAGRKSFAVELFGPTWSKAVIGRRAQDCWSDDSYEDAVCADFGPVMEKDEARYDHFRAFYTMPGSDPVWLNYERLLLRWETPNGERMLMVHSVRSQDLAIPFLKTGDEEVEIA